MSSALTQFLIDITRGHLKGSFTSDRESVLASSGLQEHILVAIRGQQIDVLWLVGAHPMALLYFARACGWQSDAYYACVSRAEESRAKPGADQRLSANVT